MMQLGAWKLTTINGGRFWLDGGVMYGVVPKSVWHSITPADENNRIQFSIHCVLAQDGKRNVLIDTGYGDKHSPLDIKSQGLVPGHPLLESLAGHGLNADEIDAVVLTHLHWDHAGGATRKGPGGLPLPTFPRATYYVNRLEWDDATSNAPELAGSYHSDDFASIADSGQLVLVDDQQEVIPGLWTRMTGGHTRGHQALIFESNGKGALYPADICPAITHLRRMWCVAYDLFPLETRRRKPQLLGEAADQSWWVLWDHDPKFAASRIQRHPKREFVVSDCLPSV